MTKSENVRVRFAWTALIFMAAMLLRALAAGVEYLPILDDSIQYINYPSSNDYGALIMQEGLFASRPLAAIMDLYVVGQMNRALIVPVLLLSAMHGLSGVLFSRLFERRFGTGAAFTVVYALLPLGVEGTYWLSASSRIVPGLLFTALAATVLDAYMETGRKRYALSYAPLVLLSYGFYEQILVLSLTLAGLAFLTRVRKTKRAYLAFAAITMVGVYAAFTGYFSSTEGAMSARMELAYPTTAWYYKVFLPDIVRQIGAAFVKGGVRTLALGFVRGLAGSLSVGGIVYLLLAVGASVGLYVLMRPTGTRRVTQLEGWGGALIWGILLAFAPITPYFFIANPYFSLRATTASFVGIALIVDLLFRVLFRRKRAYAVATAAMMCVFLIAGASEVRDYHEAGEADNELVETILATGDEMHGRVGILGIEEFATDAQNYTYHEHIASAGSSEWSLYGKLVAVSGAELDFSPVPLATKGFSFYHGWNTATKRLSGFDEIWFYDASTHTLTPLTTVPLDTGEHDFNLYTPSGSLFATVWEEEDYGYIRFE